MRSARGRRSRGPSARERAEKGQGGEGSCSRPRPRSRGYHSLEQAKSDSVRRTRKDIVRKRREERLRSRRLSRPFSQGPMRFKRRLPPPRQATNALQDPALTARPLSPVHVSSRQAVRPANSASSRVSGLLTSPPPTPTPAACLPRLTFPFTERWPMGCRVLLPG